MLDGLVYLIRHGQAGSRQNYDQLSDLGCRQADCLGQYFARENIAFASIVTGALRRQKMTASRVVAAMNQAGPPVAVHTDPGWSEFDLDEIYRGLGPRLAESDDAFRTAWEAQQIEAEAADSPLHRQWTPCDLSVFLAWTEGRINFDGESFRAFCARIRDARNRLGALPKPAAIFTSATPISLVFGLAQGMNELAAMRLTGPLMNCSWSLLETCGDETRPVRYNQTPHLPLELQTKR